MMADITPGDKPFEQIVAECLDLLNNNCHFFQKFTCEKCGARQTIVDEDLLYTKGKCEECNHVTNLEEKGCGYMLHAGGAHALDFLFGKDKK
jgi:hypothetical protein